MTIIIMKKKVNYYYTNHIVAYRTMYNQLYTISSTKKNVAQFTTKSIYQHLVWYYEY